MLLSSGEQLKREKGFKKITLTVIANYSNLIWGEKSKPEEAGCICASKSDKEDQTGSVLT